jgi:hypothetical protein
MHFLSIRFRLILFNLNKNWILSSEDEVLLLIVSVNEIKIDLEKTFEFFKQYIMYKWHTSGLRFIINIY